MAHLEKYDVVFINPCHHGPDYYSPIGINMLEALSRQAGYASTVIDLQREVISQSLPWPEGFFRAAEERLAGVSAEVFGFSVMNVGMPWASRLAKITRRLHPAAKIVFGGPHATLTGHEILAAFPEVDIIARNEGESIIVPLLSALTRHDDEALLDVPNLLVRTASGAIQETRSLSLMENLDVLPYIQYDDQLLSRVGLLSVEAGRGCPYHCSFCSSHAIWTRKPRYKSPERLVDEAQAHVDRAAVLQAELVISYEHDDFLANRPQFKKFFECKRQRAADFKYCITTRINHVNDEIAGMLASSGCASVFVGLETGSETLQLSSAKHLRVGDVLPRIQSLIDLGIHVSTNFIVGFPEETWPDLYKSFDMMLRICGLGGTVNISVMCPEPGSSLHQTTPVEQRVLLRDSAYVEELEAGGIDLSALAYCEYSHLVTIRSEAFDIEEIARLARSMTLLMADYPVSLHAALRNQDGDIPGLLRRVMAFQSLLGRRLSTATAFECLSQMLDGASGSRDREYLRYEYAKALFKNEGRSPIRPSEFGKDMPAAYYDHAKTLAAGLRVAESPAPVKRTIEIKVHAD